MITHQEKVKCRKICAEINLVLRRRRCSPNFSSLGRWQLHKYRKKYCILFFFSCTFSWLLGQSGCRTSPPPHVTPQPFHCWRRPETIRSAICRMRRRRKAKNQNKDQEFLCRSDSACNAGFSGSEGVNQIQTSFFFFLFRFFLIALSLNKIKYFFFS